MKNVPVETKVDDIKESTGERGWLSVQFTGYNPDDQGSSLHRKWRGLILAVRSDYEHFGIPILSLQSDGPMRVGTDIREVLERLESYRNCDCAGKVKCEFHKEHPDVQTERTE